MTNRFILLACALLLAVGVTGCPRNWAGYSNHSEWFRDTGIHRASFELACPADRLAIRHLGGVQVGVSGCGKRAVYVAHNQEWINNTGVQADPSAK